jgi:hypothetical protein
MKHRIQTYSIAATGDAGRHCTIFVNELAVTHPSEEGIQAPMDHRITMENGELLGRAGKGKYRSASGTIFTSNDPKAP